MLPFWQQILNGVRIVDSIYSIFTFYATDESKISYHHALKDVILLYDDTDGVDILRYVTNDRNVSNLQMMAIFHIKLQMIGNFHIIVTSIV